RRLQLAPSGRRSALRLRRLRAAGANAGRVQRAWPDVRVVSSLDPSVYNELDLMVPPLVVIDPGHGGKHNLAGSSWNNSRTPGGILEKELTLTYSRLLRNDLFNLADQKGIPLQVLLTRDADINVSGQNRASVARESGADRMVVIHFNGFNGVARGTLQVRRSAAKGNVNVGEDDRFSNRMVDGVVRALQRFDPSAYRRNPVDLGAVVTSDRYLGNSRRHHPVRCAYMEIEFIDNPAVDFLLNGPRRREVQASVSQAMAQAVYADLLNP
ncbi:MAG: N-acetylmuramoyl-L-alanine amidase, partial [Verrucomicrobiota bacterium]